MVRDFWWQKLPDEEEDTSYQDVYRTVQLVEDGNSEIHQRFLRHGRMFDPYCQLEGVTATQRSGSIFDQGGITENVLAAAIATNMSTVAKDQPKATIETDEGDFSLQKNAERLDRFIEGEFHRTRFYDRLIEIYRDACVWGTGCLRIFEDDGQIACERVLIDHVIVDEEECRTTGEPRNYHIRRFVDVEVAKAEYGKTPEDIAAIEKASTQLSRQWNSFRALKKHQVALIESWHLPSSKKTKDGVHQISVGTRTLLREAYTKSWVPLVFLHYEKRITGFYGLGIIERQAGLQRRVNKHNRMIDRLQDMYGFPRTYQKANDAAAGVKITNKPGEIVQYQTDRPQTETIQAVPAEIYQDKERAKSAIFEQSGNSEHSSQGTIPKGLETGAAVIQYNETPGLRFAIQERYVENFAMEVAEQYIEKARELFGSTGKLRTTWKNRNRLTKTIDFAQVKIAETDYRLSVEPSSILGRTPAGRIQAVTNLAQTGALDNDEIIRLVDHPDLRRAIDIKTAALNDIEATMEDLEDEDVEYRGPDELQHLEEAIPRMQMRLLEIRRMKNVPASVLDNYDVWIQTAQKMLSDAKPTPPAPPPGGVVAPFQAGLPTPAGPPAGMPPPPGGPPGAPPPSAPPALGA